MKAIVDWDRDTPQWSAVLAAANAGGGRDEDFAENALWALYAPLIQTPRDQSYVIGQIGQSLDGRIATASGHSHFINGAAAIVHLHRLRALVDAVVVGVGTVIADDPQLTVREARTRPGRAQPARVVLDPAGRIPARAKCLCDDGARRILVQGAGRPRPHGVEYLEIPESLGAMAPAAILSVLGKVGLHHILVEGGANTLSRFVAADCLHRLHVLTAPLIIGSGPSGIQLAPIDRLEDARRPRVTAFALPGGDVLFDCIFSTAP